MASRGLLTGLLGAGCVVAAGIGGYVATRSSQAIETRTGVEAAAQAAPQTGASSAPTVPVEGASQTDANLGRLAETVTPPIAQVGEDRSGRTAAAGRNWDEAATATTPKIVSAGQDRGGRTGQDRGGRTPLDTPPSDRAVGTAPESAQTTPIPAPVTYEPAVTPPAAVEAPTAPVASAPRFEELTVKANSVVGIRLDSAISSETARVEDRVVARVSRDVEVDGRTVIPEGAKLEGTVTLVDQGGRFRERARLEVRFHTLVLSNTTRIAIETDRIFRDGEAPGREATSKIGASAVVGSILGAVIGGKKGAAIGGAVGAAGGSAAVMAGGTNAAVMSAGSPYTVRLTSPIAVLVERDQDPR